MTAVMRGQASVRLSGEAGTRTASTPSAEDVALVLHTSGSTGRPKRVPLKHGNLAVSVGNVIRTYDLTPEDVSLCVMPLFHVHGLVASLLATLATGGTVVVPPRFNALGFWRVVQDHDVTWYSAVPTMHQLSDRAAEGRRAARHRTPALHPVVQRRAFARHDGHDGAAPSACRCWRRMV